jgi:pimeloyl-ACP methyl ester carboxylesterase
MEYIKTKNFKQIAYRKQGAGSVLVLLHGFPENGSLWDETALPLSQHFTVLVPDFPGSGESSLPEDNMLTMEKMADAVYAMLEAEKAKRVVIVGHSMGGYAGLAFAAKYPEKVQGLSLVHSHALADSEERKEQRRKVIALIQKGGKQAFIRQMIPGLFAPRFAQNNAAVVARQVLRGLMLPDAGLIAFYEAIIGRTDQTALLQKSRFPLQWIMGGEDSLMPCQDLVPQTVLANTNLVRIYPHCGHMSMLEMPTALQQDLHHFADYCFNAC